MYGYVFNSFFKFPCTFSFPPKNSVCLSFECTRCSNKLVFYEYNDYYTYYDFRCIRCNEVIFYGSGAMGRLDDVCDCLSVIILPTPLFASISNARTEKKNVRRAPNYVRRTSAPYAVYTKLSQRVSEYSILHAVIMFPELWLQFFFLPSQTFFLSVSDKLL